MHTFSPRTREASEFKAGLVYIVNSRTARFIQKDSISKQKQSSVVSNPSIWETEAGRSM